MDNETIVLLHPDKSELELEKLFAFKALQKNEQILENVNTFEKIIYVLNNIKPNMEVFGIPNVLMIAKAIQALNDYYKKELDWNNEICYYVAYIAFEEGWVKLPGLLSFAQYALDDISHEAELDEEQKQLQELKHQALEKYLSL